MTEPKDIETQIKERQELLEEISVWPWRTERNGFSLVAGDSGVMLEIDRDYSRDKDYPEFIGEVDCNFIATSPQFESDLIKEYQKLKKHNEIMREALKFYADNDNWDGCDDAYTVIDVVAFDNGNTAREAILKIKEIEE